MQEIWKTILGYEGKYEISNLGRVKSLRRNKFLSTNSKNSDGYVCIGLGYKVFRLNRLVAIAFIPNPENYPYVNHKNGIKTDNYVENLEWCTSSYNTFHAYKLGLRKPTKGSINGMCILTEKDVLEIRAAHIRISHNNTNTRELAEKYNTCMANIRNIVDRKSWKHI